jgi:hypothetical protein
MTEMLQNVYTTQHMHSAHDTVTYVTVIALNLPCLLTELAKKTAAQLEINAPVGRAMLM